MKCIDGGCNKKNTTLSFEDKNAIVPVECEVSDLRSIFSYFQYRAPNIDALQSPLLEAYVHDELLERMCHSNENYDYCAHNADIELCLFKHGMSEMVVCNRCKRFVCKRQTNNAIRDNTRKETDLECLLRHIRNAIAHVHVFISHGGNYIAVAFEDKNKKKNTTARIIVTRAELKKWRKILREAVYNQSLLGQ